MRLLRTILLTSGSLALVCATRATAQQVRRIVVTPYAGVFMPSARVAETRIDHGDMLADIGIRQQPALATGIGASYWFNDFAGVELASAWAFSKARPSRGLQGAVPGLSLNRNESARVVMGSAKLMVNLFRLNDRSAVRLGAGPAIIDRGGPAYESDANGEFSGLTDLGGAVSLCSRLPLTNFLSVRLRAENYMYSSQLRYRGTTTAAEEFRFASRLQNDFIFSAGLQMVWRR